jgi:hypothetical protein
VLNKKYTWNSSTNTAFTTYLNNPHITTIRFEGISSIANNVFDSCKALTTVDFSNCTNLSSIADYAFNGCDNLSFVVIPDSIASINDYAFNGCNNLSSINLSSLTALKSIGYNAFQGCALTTVDLSCCTNLTTIDHYAFYSCYSLTALKLPPAMFAANNDATIGSRAF